MDEANVAARFKCSQRERAAFEAGIKLGAVCHQFTGTPVSASSRRSVESAMEDTLIGMPYVRDAKVRILGEFHDGGDFAQVPLAEDMLDIVITVAVGDAMVTAEMRYDSRLGYPLMYVSKMGRFGTNRPSCLWSRTCRARC